MDFVPNTEFQNKEMLKAIGHESMDDLFSSIPKSLLHKRPDHDDGLSEFEVASLMEQIGNKNTFPSFESYLGAGAYSHYIPSLVSMVTSRSEFLTSYTPYQPEVSQGYLQAIFEFQSAIAALTALDAANASVYDGASACAEAILMALRINKGKNSVALSSGLHPTYRGTIELYLSGLDVEIHTYEDLEEAHDLACILVQSPNFFGVMEDMPTLAKKAKVSGALFIACGNPLSYGLFAPPGEYGADIACGDCQPLGLALNFGGPYAGYMACKQEFVRQLPGRIVGQTIDKNGEMGFVLTLQAREQHIRREKATSNICTNQALAALASLVTMLWYGPIGLKKLALQNYQKAHYLSHELEKIAGFSVSRPHFNEFTLKIPGSLDKALAAFRKHKIEPGLPLNRFFPHLDQHLLVAVTEIKSLESMQKYLEIAREL